MAYVALAPATGESRLKEAAARWDAIVAVRPDLEPAVTLQRRLIGLVVRLTDTIEHGRLPRLSLPARYVGAKLARGVPALTAEPIPVPAAALKPTLLRLCEELARGGAGDAADHIRTAIEESRMEAGSLLTASLTRDQQAIRSGAAHRGLAADLVWLVAELAVSPFAHALQQAVFRAAAEDPTLKTALDAWRCGYCPACGSWPALGEVLDRRRILRCSFCALAWELTSDSCVYCGTGGETFGVLAFELENPDRCVELCTACHGYLKTVAVPHLSPFPLLAIGDLETLDLDMAAMERGFSRPALKEFATRR